MRGVRIATLWTVAQAGITPARAGRTLRPGWWLCWPGDYPRACGAYNNSFAKPKRLMGLPPRVRGVLCMVTEGVAHPGITPARAGRTSKLPDRISLARDYPRACGAYLPLWLQLSSGRGLPPRVRGVQINETAQTPATGITPARAGRTTVRRKGLSQ